MSAKKKDTDYVAISARVHVLENRLLTRERMEQLIEAREDAEVAKVMTDCGYPEVNPLTLANLESALSRAQKELFADMGKALEGEEAVLEVFCLKHDYHNAKAILKSQAKGADPERLLVPGGRYEPQKLAADLQADAPEGYAAAFAAAIAQARDVLAQTGDPQRSDFVLDRACWQEISAAAGKTRSEFLAGYVRLNIDAINLRSAVRAYRAGADETLLGQALIPGGNVAPKAILDKKPEALAELFRDGPLSAAAQSGAELLEPGKGDMTAFERLCDDAVTAYVSKARRIPFGVETVVGYLYARLTEQTALRIILSGRLAGIEKDKIRERLREAYV